MEYIKYASQADYDGNKYSGKQFLFELAKRNPNPSYTNSTGERQFFPETQDVLLVDEIVHGKGADRIRRSIRYAPGVKSIFVDKHNEDIDLERKTGTVRFLKGKFTLDSDNPILIDFLMRCNFNGSNPDRIKNRPIKFYFKDVSKQYEKLEEDDDKDFKAKLWLKESSWDDILGYARVLLGPGVSDKDSNEVRHQMRLIIKANSSLFLDGLKDPNLIRKKVVLTAIDKDILKIDASRNTIYWKDKPLSPLVEAPPTVDVVDSFVKTLFTEEGNRVYDAIERFLSAENDEIDDVELNKVDIPELPSKQKPAQLESPHATAQEVEELLDACVKAEVITKKGTWFYFGDFKTGGRKLFLAEILGNRAMYESCKIELSKYDAISKN